MVGKGILKFSVDRSLGNLAKWLRILGFDTLYQEAMSDSEFLTTLKAGSIAVTRSRKVFSRIRESPVLFIRSNDIEQQLMQVIKELNLSRTETNPFSRCLRCNEPIAPVDRETVVGKVPDYVFEMQPDFSICRRCHRIFWPGSHTGNSLIRVDALFEAVFNKI